MKKLLLLACVSLIAFSTVRAQEESLSAGSLMFQTTVTGLSAEFIDNFSIAMNVRGGYFVADRLPILAGVGVAYAKDKGTAFGVQAGLGYYIFDGLYLNALGSLEYFKPEEGDGTEVFGVIGELGYAIFLNRHIAVDPKLILAVPFKDGYKTTLGLGVGFTIFL